jgi:magnesium chelatase family protein
VLFLDELGEFAPAALDALRQPFEERVVRIARASTALTFPAAFQLIACTNPCPCGLGDPACRCSEAQRMRYRRRLSAPLLDRFDLRLRISPPEAHDAPGERSEPARTRVEAAACRQRDRYRDRPWSVNAHVAAGALSTSVPLHDDALDAWHDLVSAKVLTGRGAARVRRVARTVADLDDSATVTAAHVEIAASLRADVP